MAYKGSRAASLSLSVLHPRGSTPRAVARFCPRTWCRRPLRGCSRISVTRASRGDWLSIPRPALPLSCLPVWGTRSSLWVQLFPNVKGKACLEQCFFFEHTVFPWQTSYFSQTCSIGTRWL